MPWTTLQRLAPLDERREHQIAEWPVLEQERSQYVAVDRDVAQRLPHHRGQEDGLSGEQIQLAEEAGRTVSNDLVSGRIEDRHLALTDGDERIARISHPVQHVADARRPLLAEPGQCRQLRG